MNSSQLRREQLVQVERRIAKEMADNNVWLIPSWARAQAMREKSLDEE